MILKEVFLQALQSIAGHRVRALMTMTGIGWGIVAVVLLMAYGNGFHNALMTGFRRAFSSGTVVTERTREIGVRKALGAKRSLILIQFLLEALVITFLGGLLGILLSYLLVTFAGHRPFLADLLEDPSRQTDIYLMLSGDVVLTATSILMVVGIFSRLWPALRASKTDPIESLRYEQSIEWPAGERRCESKQQGAESLGIRPLVL
jgi:ABC-type antimicrobial peptide transport system permease subunit